jgi:hypothetical protein
LPGPGGEEKLVSGFWFFVFGDNRIKMVDDFSKELWVLQPAKGPKWRDLDLGMTSGPFLNQKRKTKNEKP